jgi:RNA polymerase sigma factor (sigma-70 family)
MKADEQFDRQIHARLLAGDVTAPAELAEAYLQEIERRLGKKFARVHDQALLAESAAEAILGFSKNPQNYDPTKLSLASFLRMAAERDLLNALRRERPHLGKEILSDDVEEAVLSRNSHSEGSVRYAVEEKLIASLDLDTARRTLDTHFRDPLDRKLLELLRSGERSTTAYADILGINTLSAKQQKAIVKQHKDRITKEIERLGAKRHDR